MSPDIDRTKQESSYNVGVKQKPRTLQEDFYSNKDLTEIAFILDCSGFTAGLEGEAIEYMRADGCRRETDH